MELRSLLIRLSRVLGRFQRERGMALSRPVAANSLLQSYFIDPDFGRGGDVPDVWREDVRHIRKGAMTGMAPWPATMA